MGEQQPELAVKAGKHPKRMKRDRPLTIRGVGQGGQKCPENNELPIALEAADGTASIGTFDTPTVPNSSLPALLGLAACRASRIIIDTPKNAIYMVGSDEDYDLMSALPPGTKRYDCAVATSGHMMLPCADFDRAAATINSMQEELQPKLAFTALPGSSSSTQGEAKGKRSEEGQQQYSSQM